MAARPHAAVVAGLALFVPALAVALQGASPIETAEPVAEIRRVEPVGLVYLWPDTN